MRSPFRPPFLLAIAGLILLLAAPLPSYAQGAALAVTLETNKGCGPNAVFDLGEFSTFRYSVSQTALVTLRVQFPNGTVSTLLNSQVVPGGALQTILGRIGNPTGERRIILDATAGTETAHAECTYTARGATPGPFTATIETDRGCGPSAVYNFGETSVFRYRVSEDALVTLRLQFPDGTVRTLLANQPVPGGVTRTFAGTIGNPPGERCQAVLAVERNPARGGAIRHSRFAGDQSQRFPLF